MTLGNFHYFNVTNKLVEVLDKFDKCQSIHVNDIFTMTSIDLPS